LGEFTQAAYAFSVLQSSLSLVVNQFQALTEYASVRLRFRIATLPFKINDFERSTDLASLARYRLGTAHSFFAIRAS
jgi:ABC-type uncharacterized transport system fused permease/ATPase subunit